ncbi:MAG: NADP-dependent malic enzyme [Myxococcales bacterium]|nr:NADP-dependent malic enzyme [Myxococcales bacterium]
MSFSREDALEYHAKGRPGKLEVNATKPFATQLDLSLAYTPGVAEPCREIHKNPDAVYDYTVKGNLVAVVTNGTAVLGLGNIGPLASKPVMEGKGVLFKRFAAIDVFDLELKSQNSDEFILGVKMLEPTFGGINLEDIGAPECFYIEKRLREEMNIPVFHDDQHGTAIIMGAALLNAVEIVNKSLDEIKIVFSGAGAAGFACAMYCISLGVKKENVIMTDIQGVVYKGREPEGSYLEEVASDTSARTLAEALQDADVFIGLSAPNILTPEMLISMKRDPIIFAMANPVPEIDYDLACKTRPDAIVATGRSDYPNQINNVLGFPFIFRGALDVRATTINEEMKHAATKAIADLTKEDVPDDVLQAYRKKRLQFGRDYIIPKPFDSRVLYRVASAVAKAAMDSGVARKPIQDFQAYQEKLERMLHPTREVVQRFIGQAYAQKRKIRIVFPEAENPTILRACHVLMAEGIAHPILLGNRQEISNKAKHLGLDFVEGRYDVIDPRAEANIPESYVNAYAKLRERKGITRDGAFQQLQQAIRYAMMMVKLGDADGCVAGISHNYPEIIKPALQIVGLSKETPIACGMYMILDKQGKARFFADTTVNIDPNAEELAHIAVASSDLIRQLGITPRVAMLSFSNFGSARNSESIKVQKATQLAKEMRPDLMIDGEMRVDVAVNPKAHIEDFPFCELKDPANLFIFPSLNAGNISYQLMQYLGGMEVVGPILIGLSEPVNALPRNCDLQTVVSVSAVTAVMAKKFRSDKKALAQTLAAS